MHTGISGVQAAITKDQKPGAMICEAGAADKVNPSPFVHLLGVTFWPKAKGSALAHSLSVLAPPRRLHVIDTLRGVQVGGDPSRAETRRGRWSRGSFSAPTSAGRAGKSFLFKPREMSTRTARLGFLDGWGAGGRGRACGAPRRVRGPWEWSWATIRSAEERWRVPPYPRRPHLRSDSRTRQGRE